MRTLLPARVLLEIPSKYYTKRLQNKEWKKKWERQNCDGRCKQCSDRHTNRKRDREGRNYCSDNQGDDDDADSEREGEKVGLVKCSVGNRAISGIALLSSQKIAKGKNSEFGMIFIVSK